MQGIFPRTAGYDLKRAINKGHLLKYAKKKFHVSKRYFNRFERTSSKRNYSVLFDSENEGGINRIGPGTLLSRMKVSLKQIDHL